MNQRASVEEVDNGVSSGNSAAVEQVDSKAAKPTLPDAPKDVSADAGKSVGSNASTVKSVLNSIYNQEEGYRTPQEIETAITEVVYSQGFLDKVSEKFNSFLVLSPDGSPQTKNYLKKGVESSASVALLKMFLVAEGHLDASDVGNDQWANFDDTTAEAVASYQKSQSLSTSAVEDKVLITAGSGGSALKQDSIVGIFTGTSVIATLEQKLDGQLILEPTDSKVVALGNDKAQGDGLQAREIASFNNSYAKALGDIAGTSKDTAKEQQPEASNKNAEIDTEALSLAHKEKASALIDAQQLEIKSLTNEADIAESEKAAKAIAKKYIDDKFDVKTGNADDALVVEFGLEGVTAAQVSRTIDTYLKSKIKSKDLVLAEASEDEFIKEVTDQVNSLLQASNGTAQKELLNSISGDKKTKPEAIGENTYMFRFKVS